MTRILAGPACRLALALLAVLALAWPGAAPAVLTIEINKGVKAGIPIAVVPFQFVAVAPGVLQPTDVIRSDLNFSGRFDTLPPEDFLDSPHDLESVRFKDWRLIKAEALVVGKVFDIGNDQYEVRFRLIDVFRERQIEGRKFVIPAHRLRKTAHQISDIIYEKLTGVPGTSDTRIAFVTVEGESTRPRYLLRVADADGWNPRTILESTRPILSPAWSPDGARLAYVSFEDDRSMVFVQDIRSGQRSRAAEFEGINSAPAWSPDGRRLALTLSKDGNPEIYIFTLNDSSLRRLTRNLAIDTEPAWSPDGDSLVFTSDRSGEPQLYSIPLSGEPARRLTRHGKYNAGGSFSPDGQSIVLVTNQGQGYRIGLYSVRDRSIRELTSSSQDESPSFAPNGDIIMYATRKNGRNVLATVSTDGRVRQTLKFQEGAVREPAWSPYNRNF